MDLWIRSQNGENLIRCNDIAIQGNRIVGYFAKETEYENLGIYESKERALEVLDEIQELLEPVHVTEISKKEGIIGANILYEMPEE